METIIENADSGLVFLKGVRLSFHDIWRVGKIKGKDKVRFDAQFIFTDDDIAGFNVMAGYVLGKMKELKPSTKSINETEYPRFAKVERENVNSMILKTTNSFAYPARYFDANGAEVPNPAESNVEAKVLYSGCRVNAKIQFTIKLNQGAIEIWPNLVGIQFAAHDEPFAGLTVEDISSGFGTVAMDTSGASGTVTTGADADPFGGGGTETAEEEVNLDEFGIL